MAFIRVKYSKGNPYLYLVESYREGGKVRQRVLEYLGPSRDISQKQFLNVVNQSYKSSDKMGDVVKVPELTKKIQKKTGLSKEEVHKKLYDAYIEKKIDLQPGKGKDSLKGEDDATFQYMQPRELGTTTQKKSEYQEIVQIEKDWETLKKMPRDAPLARFVDKNRHLSPLEVKQGVKALYGVDFHETAYARLFKEYNIGMKTTAKKSKKSFKLGTTETKIKYHFDEINEETRAGNMVQIPKLWREMKKEGISRKEFEKTLYKLEKERKIDLQVASATYVLKPDDKKLGMPHPTRGHINYVVWRKPTKIKKTKKSSKLGTTGQEVQKFNKMTIYEFQEHIDDYEHDKDTKELNRIKRAVKSEKINNQATKLYYIDASLRRIEEGEE